METLSLLTWAFDIFLCFGLVWIAWCSLNCENLFRGIVLFISFGLLMALAWVRLNAPDVALAEAAIGAGLTGALLMAALARLQNNTNSQTTTQTNAPEQLTTTAQINTRKAQDPRWILFPLLSILAAGLAYSVISLPVQTFNLQQLVAENMSLSGVSNQVTAVLINFRGYDTLLEMIVLLVALLGVWSLNDSDLPVAAEHKHSADLLTANPVMSTLTRLLVPVLILVAAYLLWVGAHAPGGAFQAGSVLGAAGVLLMLSGWRPGASLSGLVFRLLLIAGSGAFISMAIYSLIMYGQLLFFPPASAGMLILLLETGATFSIAVTLAALFAGAEPEEARHS